MSATLQQRRAVLGPAYRLFYDLPFAPVRGEDVWLYDADGRRHLDAYNNVPVVGHSNARVVAAMAQQAATLCTHTRYLHGAVLDYAEALLARLPASIDRIMFTCTGSEANDLALRMAEAATGGHGVVVTDNAYHGVTRLLAQLSPSLAAPAGFVRTVPPPVQRHGETVTEAAGRWGGYVAAACAALHAAEHPPAALLIDTVLASDGIFPPQPGLFDAGAAAARAAGAVVIADEVQAGFGRLGGAWWGFEHAALNPDIVTMGKPMGNGYPVGAAAARADIVEAFAATGRYFNTFGGNPVAAAAGLAVLEELQEHRLPQQAAGTGAYLHEQLHAQLDGHPHIAAIRGRGLYWGVEMAGSHREAGAKAAHTVNHMRRHGVLINHSGPHGRTLKIRPPLTFTRAHANLLLSALGAALADI